MNHIVKNANMKKKLLIFDPGHGGRDPGAVGNNLKESLVVLDFCNLLSEYMTALYDCDVIKTRSKDVFVDLRDRPIVAAQKKADLFLSFHINSFTNRNANGYEDFIHTQANESVKLIRDKIHDHVSRVWTNAGRRNRGKKFATFFVLNGCRKLGIPAILLEMGFISNKTDSNMLKDKFFIFNLIVATAFGIAESIGLEEKSSKDHIGSIIKLKMGIGDLK